MQGLRGTGRSGADTAAVLTRASFHPELRTQRAFRARLGSTGVILAVLLGVGFLALFLGVLSGVLALVAAAGVILPLVLWRLQGLLTSAFNAFRDLLRGQVNVLLLLQDALVLAAVLRADWLSAGSEATVIAAVVVLEALRVVLWSLQLLNERQQALRIEARNLPHPVPPLPPRPGLLAQGGSAAVLSSGVMPLSLGVGLATGAQLAVPVAAVLAALVVLLVVVGVAPRLLAHLRMTRGRRRLRVVHEAVLRYEPVVILYSTSEPNDTYWITTWLDTLEHLGRRSVVIVRNPDVLDLLPPSSVPFVCLPGTGDVGRFVLPTTRVALYVAHGAENNRLLRRRTLRSAFIAHGESDKGVFASPLAKAYDQVWVAGEAGRQRYADADVGVPPELIRLVGRPQTRRVQRSRPREAGSRFRVLYAPSWEGVEDDPLESSLLHSGQSIVRALLDRDDVQLLYRPHPKTGDRNAAYVAEHQEIVQLIERAGAPHQVESPYTHDVFDSFNAVDALIADVSAVVSDFLASDKPYLVVNATGASDDVFRAANPSTGGAYLLGTAGEGLDAALRDAQGPDSMRERRRATRTQLIGPATDDPLAPFVAAVDALAATAPSPRS